MIRQSDDTPQDKPRQSRANGPKTNKRLRDKIRLGKWSQAELEWLLAHLGPALTPAIATEIRAKLHALHTGKGVH